MQPLTTAAPQLRLLSLNIRGLGKKTKYLLRIIRKYKPDITCLQETNVNNSYKQNKIMGKLGITKAYFNFAPHQNNGTAILQTSNKWELKQGTTHLDGRVILAKLVNADTSYNIANIYAPGGEQRDRPFFFNELSALLYPLTDRHRTIMIGDYNITLTDKDLRGQLGPDRIGRQELKEIVDILDLQDTFRVLHPHAQQFTYANTGHDREARLDRAYVSSGIPIHKHENLGCTTTFTNHKGILIELGVNPMGGESPQRGSSHWKFNDSLLENEQFKEAIQETIRHTLLGDKNIRIKMKELRETIKLISQHFGKIKKREINEEIKQLEDILKYSSDLKVNNEEEYHRIVDRLEELEMIGYQGAKVRSRIQDLNDKPSKKYIHLEISKQNSNNRHNHRHGGKYHNR